MKLYNYREKVILRKLSEDSRASISDLAKIAKCSRVTASKTLRALKNRYEIKFGLEVNEDELGLIQRHLIIAKLIKKPKLDDLKEIFKNDLYADNIYLCKGDFDLIIHTVNSDPMKYIVWESLLPSKLGEYGLRIYPSELMNTNFGYFPITSKQIDIFAKKIDKTDKQLLMLLAENSNMSMSDLSRSLKISRNTLYYRLFMLRKNGIIKRFTISVNKPMFDYILAYAVNYHFNTTSSIRSVKMMGYYKGYDEQLPILNTFQILAPMSGSYRFFGIGLFDNESDAKKNAIKAHKNIFNQEKVEIKYARIIGIVKGSYPFRNIDINLNYTRFKWNEEGLNNIYPK